MFPSPTKLIVLVFLGFLDFTKLLEYGCNGGLISKTCVNDAVRLWNIAPNEVIQARSINMAKKEIKTFVKSLPIQKIIH